ncbi:MAG: DUF6880 family protein [Cyanobacteriota bacterium]
MASKRSLNAKNLEALGAEALAVLLIEVSEGNAAIQRRLRLALAAAEGVQGAVQEVRKRLTAIDRSSTFVHSQRRKALVSDLEAQLQAISGPIAMGDPEQAFDLLLRFLEISDGVLERCPDGTGVVVGVFDRAVQQLGTLGSAIQREPETLAWQIAELLTQASHEQFDGLVPAEKNVLGDWGLNVLGHYCRDRGAGDGNPYLLQIAEARRDVEGYLAQFTAEELSWRDTSTTVGRYLLSCGRAEQALKILNGAANGVVDLQDSQWHDTRIAALDALNRCAEAQELRWEWFSRTLSISHLRDHLKRLDDFEDVNVEEQALQVAEQHPVSLLGLHFLVEWGALSRAARHVFAHEDEWEGNADMIHTLAAERLSADHPLAATLMLRPLVFFALWMGAAKRYRNAAEHLRNCEQLADRINDWQGHPDHRAYVERMQDMFGVKPSFWKLMKR